MMELLGGEGWAFELVLWARCVSCLVGSSPQVTPRGRVKPPPVKGRKVRFRKVTRAHDWDLARHRAIEDTQLCSSHWQLTPDT